MMGLRRGRVCSPVSRPANPSGRKSVSDTNRNELLGPRTFLLSFAVIKVLIHLAVGKGYGYFRDEFYYLACSEHIAWGYVDQPPLSILILWIGRNCHRLTDTHDTSHPSAVSIVGAEDESEVDFIAKELARQELVIYGGGKGISLTFRGWLEFMRLRSSETDTRKAFMAMEFRNERLDPVFY